MAGMVDGDCESIFTVGKFKSLISSRCRTKSTQHGKWRDGEADLLSSCEFLDVPFHSISYLESLMLMVSGEADSSWVGK